MPAPIAAPTRKPAWRNASLRQLERSGLRGGARAGAAAAVPAARSRRVGLQLDAFHVGEGLAEHALGDGAEGGHVAGRQLQVGRGRSGPGAGCRRSCRASPGRSPRAARPETRPWPWPNRRSPPPSPTAAAQRPDQQRVVGAAQQQSVDSRRGRQREDELPVLVALAQQRRDRAGPPPPRPPARTGARPRRAAPARAWRARRPPRPGSRP